MKEGKGFTKLAIARRFTIRFMKAHPRG